MAIVLASAGTVAMLPRPAEAVVQTFNSQPDWLAAVGGPGQATVFHFDGPTEQDGLSVNDPSITPSYSSQGVDFLPFTGSNVYPVIFRSQGHQIPDPNRDGLVANNVSPNPESDLEGRAIQLAFNLPARSVGVFTNRAGDGDGGYLQAFDAGSNLIGQVTLDAGVFGGISSDQLIARVSIVNTFNSDINFGIWDLQYSPNGIPEPSTIALAALANAALVGRARCRRAPTTRFRQPLQPTIHR
jgi:hypothetical protein